MNAFQLIDVLSASFFSLVAIWAAAVQRHWFLRFAVLSLFLLAPLLIPAYEVTIVFAIETLLILTGVWLGRGRPGKPRLSLATALLAMAVVAVVATVVSRIPHFTWKAWTEMVTNSVSTSILALLLLWIVAGRARLRVRVVLGIVGFASFVVVYHSGQILTNAVSTWQDGNDWKNYISESYRSDYLLGWTLGELPTLALGSAICLAAIALARASGWFNTNDESPPRCPATAKAARLALVTLVLIIATPLGYLFYRLLTPQPLPVVQLPTPNGYDDLAAAGRMVPPNMTLDQFDTNNGQPPITDAQLAAELQTLQPVFDRIHLGLARESLMDVRVLASPADDKFEQRKALRAADEALWLRYAYLTRTGRTATVAERIDCLLTTLEVVGKAYRSTGLRWFDYSQSHQTPDFVFGELSLMLSQMDAAQCREVARRLYEYDQTRESLAEQSRIERILDEHRDWRQHLRLMLSDWSGIDPYEWFRPGRMSQDADYRTKLLSFAVRAYCLERHERPPNLDALCPEYVKAIPADPYGQGAIKMKLTTKGVAIYSVGINRIDDNGVPYRVDAQGRLYQDQGDKVREISAADLGIESTNATTTP